MPIAITPKVTFLSDPKKASAHCDVMASPAFKEAATLALLEFQMRISGGEPTVAAVTAFKLRGAQEFLSILMNLGVPESPSRHLSDDSLTPPEELLKRAYEPQPITKNA